MCAAAAGRVKAAETTNWAQRMEAKKNPGDIYRTEKLEIKKE